MKNSLSHNRSENPIDADRAPLSRRFHLAAADFWRVLRTGRTWQHEYTSGYMAGAHDGMITGQGIVANVLERRGYAPFAQGSVR